MYARRNGDQEFTFDFAEGLINNNLLMVDRETRSVWSQLHGRAVSGPAEGTPIEILPSMQTTWKFWRDRHPDTEVMIADRGRKYLYRDWTPGTPRPQARAREHDISKLGLGLSLGGETWFFPLKALLQQESPIERTIGSRPVKIYFDEEGLTAWAEDEAGNLIKAFMAYRDGWLDFYPSSKVYGQQ